MIIPKTWPHGTMYSLYSYQICHHRRFDFVKLIIILKICENRDHQYYLFISGGKSRYHKVGLNVGYKWTEFCYNGRHSNGEVHKERNCNILTNCGLVTPYDGVDLGPAKGTRANNKPLNELILSVMFSGIHLGEISQATVLYNEFEKCTFKISVPSHRDLKVKLCFFARPQPLL